MIVKEFIAFALLTLLASFNSLAEDVQDSEHQYPNKSLTVQTINYLQPKISISRSLYVKALLKRVMEITELEYGPYKINIINSDPGPRRKGLEMIKGNNINLIWKSEDVNSVKSLIKVPFHTMKGILGYRVFIIKSSRQNEFSEIYNLKQLQALKPGQVEFWTDTYIYKKNNFKVVTSQNMTSLYPMLEKNRFDFLPMGASEVSQEYSSLKSKYRSLSIETDLLIKYPLYMFFMVSPKAPVLAERLEKGLLTIEKNGDFKKLFNQFIQPDLDAIDLNNRRVIHLKGQ